MLRTEIINELTEMVESHLELVKSWQKMDVDVQSFKPDKDSWSITQCISHVNKYGDFYIIEIEEALLKSKKSPDAHSYKPGWLGNYAAMSMLPKKGKIKNKMKTFKSMDPVHSETDPLAFEKFIKQQEKILDILQRAPQYHLGKVTTGITIGKWIRFKLGDTLRFLIYHNHRHILQAKNVLALEATHKIK